MTTIIVTNEFVQLNSSLFKKAISYSTQDYVKTKDLSSPKCHKVENDT